MREIPERTFTLVWEDGSEVEDWTTLRTSVGGGLCMDYKYMAPRFDPYLFRFQHNCTGATAYTVFNGKRYEAVPFDIGQALLTKLDCACVIAANRHHLIAESVVGPGDPRSISWFQFVRRENTPQRICPTCDSLLIFRSTEYICVFCAAQTPR